jgi:hypothetical protein
MLEQHRALLETGAQQLLAQETLDQSELAALKSRLPIAAASVARQERH